MEENRWREMGRVRERKWDHGETEGKEREGGEKEERVARKGNESLLT